MQKTKLIHEIRAAKSKKELANIVKAQKISEKVLKDTLAKLKTGISEIQVTNIIKKLFEKTIVINFYILITDINSIL